MVVFFAVLMLFGAKSLPNALRTLGKWNAKLRQISQEVQRELLEIEEPFRNAHKAWEEEMQEFTVSSPTRPRIEADPPDSDRSDQSDQSDPTAPTAPTDPTAPQQVKDKPHAE